MELTKEQLTKRQIYMLKRDLALSDYKAIKYAEGCYTEEEYAPVKAERQAKRLEIRRLEESLKAEE